MSRPNRGTRGMGYRRPAWDDPEGPESGFACVHCGAFVPDVSPGTSQRNHCPRCLWSLHVDLKPGDRQSLCRAEMEPAALWVSGGDELRIVHRCSGCGVLKPNRIAGDDSEEALEALVQRLTTHWGARPRPLDR